MQTSSVLPGICPVLQLAGTLQRPLTAAFQLSVQPAACGLADICAPAAGMATTPSNKAQSSNVRLRVIWGAFHSDGSPVSVARWLEHRAPGHGGASPAKHSQPEAESSQRSRSLASRVSRRTSPTRTNTTAVQHRDELLGQAVQLSGLVRSRMCPRPFAAALHALITTLTLKIKAGGCFFRTLAVETRVLIGPSLLPRRKPVMTVAVNPSRL